jgi:CheY-like chemotaxis protein
MTSIHNRPVDILLVEDNPGDILLTTEMLKDTKVSNVVNVVTNGEEALEYLRKKGRFFEAPTPDLVLLDLKLPKLNGHEVLAQMKEDIRLRCIPVVVLTSSDADDDVLKAYSEHANCYVTKPAGIDQFAKIVRSIDDFWLSVVRLPTRKNLG